MRSRSSDEEPAVTRGKPASTSLGREKQLISLATDLAEKRLREGTATAAEVVHFLKLGSSRETLEQERLAEENNLLRAKVEQLSSTQGIEVLMNEAIDAMRSYSGQPPRRPSGDPVDWVDENVY